MDKNKPLNTSNEIVLFNSEYCMKPYAYLFEEMWRHQCNRNDLSHSAHSIARRLQSNKPLQHRLLLLQWYIHHGEEEKINRGTTKWTICSANLTRWRWRCTSIFCRRNSPSWTCEAVDVTVLLLRRPQLVAAFLRVHQSRRKTVCVGHGWQFVVHRPADATQWHRSAADV